jgi:large subunit ribosomal protein L3
MSEMRVVIGRKIGMTQHFAGPDARGVTAVQVEPAKVLRRRTKEHDGYEAIQLGALADEKGKKVLGKARLGQSGGTPYRVIAEFPVPDGDVKAGSELGIDQFAEGDTVVVSAVSKGKGFAGTVKRHNFSRGPKTHGSRNYRQPGSIGGTDAARVFPGQKMPGRMGNRKVSIKNQSIVAVHADLGVLLIAGSVPGPTGAPVTVTAP